MPRKKDYNKQIKTSLTEQEYQQVERVKKKYFFRSDYEFVRASVLCLSSLLEGKGLDGFKGLPEELTEVIADTLYRRMSDHRNPTSPQLAKPNNQPDRVPTVWVNRFIDRHYKRLYHLYHSQPQKSRERDGKTQTDIFQDTILALYGTSTEGGDFAEWERKAIRKFGHLLTEGERKAIEQ